MRPRSSVSSVSPLPPWWQQHTSPSMLREVTDMSYDKMPDHLKELSEQCVSIWLDDLNRPLIASGGLQNLIDTSHVVGVTTDPSIFAAALSKGDAYDDQIKALAAEGRTIDETVFALTTEDVRNACDLMF